MTILRFQAASALIVLASFLFAAGLMQPAFGETGKASFYHDKFQGRETTSGVRFDQAKPMCAHKTLPLWSVVKVTRLSNGRSEECTILDRGPFVSGRIIDLPKSIARKLGMLQAGVVKVRVERL